MLYIKNDTFIIEDVAKYSANEAEKLISDYCETHKYNNGLTNRSVKSYLYEWAVCTLCYRWHIMREKTKDADMEFELEPEVNFIYNILGPVALLILKLYR